MRPLVLTGYADAVPARLRHRRLGGGHPHLRRGGAARARIEVEGNRQVVQHPTGGVIKAIHARDGDEVEAGDVLIELDGEDLCPELGIVEGQWFEILARKSRLQRRARRARRHRLRPRARRSGPSPPEIAHADRRAGAAVRRPAQDASTRRRRSSSEQQTQIANQNDGLVALQAATRSQIELLEPRDRGPADAARPGADPDHPGADAAARAGAARGQPRARSRPAIAENRGKIAEIEIERVRLTSKAREEAIAELRDLEFREIELREKRRQLIDRIARLDLRAPVSGIVYGRTADTLRAVIRPAEPVMYIVPKDTPLIVRTQIDTIHIDQVHVGQEAMLRFSAFDQRTTPELTGHVTAVSADAYEDERTGQRYYKADIRIDDGDAGEARPRDAAARDAGGIVHPHRRPQRAQLLRQADGGLLHPRLPRRADPRRRRRRRSAARPRWRRARRRASSRHLRSSSRRTDQLDRTALRSAQRPSRSRSTRSAAAVRSGWPADCRRRRRMATLTGSPRTFDRPARPIWRDSGVVPAVATT